ncbi:MAG: hypothetical protein HeimC3_39260 [Candidatus Heimdallarchaeota archaeon LC_3]|nr:MAG: hypothetical protein HeimC3_39260 [Candidatus Heimdallarchaeota archaeon LC_3]
MKKNASFISFLGYLTNSFFRWWWALITGIASLISLLVSKDNVYDKIFLLIIVFCLFSVLFLLLTTINQSWKLYKEYPNKIQIIEIKKSKNYNSEFVFILKIQKKISIPILAEIIRVDKNESITIGLIEIIDINENNYYQAKEIWIASGHLRDFKNLKFNQNHMKINPDIKLRTLQRAKEKIFE